MKLPRETVITLKDGVIVHADTDTGIWIHIPETGAWAFITSTELAQYALTHRDIKH